MSRYRAMTPDELSHELKEIRKRYEQLQALNLSLNMARGKPSREQLELSLPLLDVLNSQSDDHAEDGTDCLNYGVLDGIPEAKKLMATLLDDAPENIIVLGNSSLTGMYDAMARFMMFGTLGSTPWGKLKEVKWLCPTPGYDRHFAICEALGIRMIPVPLHEDGPDMDVVESLVANDATIKGMWCVPQYSNPSGITYSEEVVKRLSSMKCAAEDFRIMWDNAYAVHHLYSDASEQDHVYDIARACHEAGNPNRYLKFGSTSKITFPGAGVAALACSPEQRKEILTHMQASSIGHDKLNQLRHARFLDEGRGIAPHMEKHAELMAPKFECVEQVLESELGSTGIASWTRPRGGYFISFDGPEGTAKRIVDLAKKAGVVVTNAGATWPYGNDPADSNIRLAPSLPPLNELQQAMEVFACCVKLATLEQLVGSE